MKNDTLQAEVAAKVAGSGRSRAREPRPSPWDGSRTASTGFDPFSAAEFSGISTFAAGTASPRKHLPIISGGRA